MLYYKPGPDMDIEGKENFDPNILREHGKFLKEDLESIADQLEKLKKAGWSYCGGLYDVMCSKDISVEEAKKELKELGIEIDEDNLMELEEEEE
ncbi:MAG: hypothetical protein QME61_01740 [Patescibacteria group bacterium]|nr:hypothetical protein [Patescibacteria group bacterium]